MMHIHESVSLTRIMQNIEDTDYDLGYCIACGAEYIGVPGNAEAYQCPSCHEQSIYGDVYLLCVVA